MTKTRLASQPAQALTGFEHHFPDDGGPPMMLQVRSHDAMAVHGLLHVGAARWTFALHRLPRDGRYFSLQNQDDPAARVQGGLLHGERLDAHVTGRGSWQLHERMQRALGHEELLDRGAGHELRSVSTQARLDYYDGTQPAYHLTSVNEYYVFVDVVGGSCHLVETIPGRPTKCRCGEGLCCLHRAVLAAGGLPLSRQLPEMYDPATAVIVPPELSGAQLAYRRTARLRSPVVPEFTIEIHEGGQVCLLDERDQIVEDNISLDDEAFGIELRRAVFPQN